MKTAATTEQISERLRQLAKAGWLVKDQTLLRLFFRQERQELVVFDSIQQLTLNYYNNDQVPHPGRVIPRQTYFDAIVEFEIVDLKKLVTMLNRLPLAIEGAKSAANRIPPISSFKLS